MPDEEGFASALWREAVDGLNCTARVVSYGMLQEPVESALNAGNVFNLPADRLESDVRADIRLRLRRLDLGVKPRFDLKWEKWDSGARAGDSDFDTDCHLYGWTAMVRLPWELSLACGRENLQWGPSYLLSPSNPFNENNGRYSPKFELPGSDYARMTWTPDSEWTLSVIAAMAGRQTALQGIGADVELPDSRRTYAVKIDRTIDRKFVSVIASQGEGTEPRLGFYGGWNASDTMILYVEGSLGKDGTGQSDAEFLAGSTYTLSGGGALTLEYFCNENGLVDGPITAAVMPLRMSDAREVFLRRNYLLLQYADPKVFNRFEVTLRGTAGFDDMSVDVFGMIQYDWGDHAQLFAISAVNSGGPETEFGSLVSYFAMAGVQYAF